MERGEEDWELLLSEEDVFWGEAEVEVWGEEGNERIQEQGGVDPQ